MRTFVVTGETDLQALRNSLIDRRLGAAKATAALDRLRALNPHVDIERPAAGTLLFVPDGPEFTARAAASPTQAPLDEFRGLLENALNRTAEELKSGLAAREQERSAVKAALDSDVFKRATTGDQQTQQQAADAAKALGEEEAADRAAAQELEASRNAALAALAELGKLVG